MVVQMIKTSKSKEEIRSKANPTAKASPAKKAKPVAKASPAKKAKPVAKASLAKKANPVAKASPAKKANPASQSQHAAADKLKEHQQNFTKKAKDAFAKTHKGAAVDHKVLIAHHKKNLEVLGHTNKKAAEVMKSIANLQSHFVKQTFADLNSMMRGMMTKKSDQPADASTHAEMMKGSFQRAVDHAHSVSSMISHSHKEIHARVSDRVEEGKAEVKAHIKQSTHH